MCIPLAGEGGELARSEAINKAGRQRMLTQRIVKSYCQVGMGVDAAAARAQLAASIRLFDEQLAALAPAGVDALRELWLPFRALATQPVTRAGAAALRAQAPRLLQAAEALTAGLEKGDRAAHLVNLAGRQRMLSQRIAKAYLLQAWRVGDAAEEEEMRAAMGEFGAALEVLRSARENTTELRTELAAVALQWEWLAGAVSSRGDAYPLLVADASESILTRMERVTSLYEALGAP